MKNYLTLFALLASLVVPARASVEVTLDAGELTAPVSAPMQVDGASPSSNGSLLLLISLDFYTGNSDDGGNELPGAGFTSFQVESVPEPFTFALFGLGSLALFCFARHRKAV